MAMTFGGNPIISEFELNRLPRIIQVIPAGTEYTAGAGIRSVAVDGGTYRLFAFSPSGTAVRSLVNSQIPTIGLDEVSSYDGGYGGIDYNRDLLFEIPLHMKASPAATGVMRFGLTSRNDATTYIERQNFQLRWDVIDQTANFRFCRMLSPTSLSSPVINNATNASPIVLTFASNHGMTNGEQIEVGNVGGNTAANGIWIVNNVTSTTCELVGSTGNGEYTSGGEAHYISDILYTHPSSTLRMYYVRSFNNTFTVSVGSTQLITTTGRTGRRSAGFTASVLCNSGALSFLGHTIGPIRIAIR